MKRMFKATLLAVVIWAVCYGAWRNHESTSRIPIKVGVWSKIKTNPGKEEASFYNPNDLTYLMVTNRVVNHILEMKPGFKIPHSERIREIWFSLAPNQGVSTSEIVFKRTRKDPPL